MRPLVNVDYIIHNLDKLTPEQAYNLGYDSPIRKFPRIPLSKLEPTTEGVSLRDNIDKSKQVVKGYQRKLNFEQRLGDVLSRRHYKETGIHLGDIFNTAYFDLMDPGITEKEIKNIGKSINRKYVIDAIKDIVHSGTNDLLSPNYRLVNRNLKILEEASRLKPKIFKILPSIITKK